jgi:hypothetical protein
VDRRSAASDLNGAASGTGRPGLATGGRVFGVGTGTSDSNPYMLSKGEYVVKESAAKAIGYNNLDRLNGGDTQPLTPLGFSYGPAAAPPRSVASVNAAGSGPASFTGNLYLDSGELLGVVRGVASEVTAGALGSASRGSSYQRGGH